jgi:hypothetical protein
MFERLQKKWKVSGWRLLLILVTFAIGGSLTGIAGKKLMPYLGIENTIIYIVVYVMLVTIIWPLMVLIVSIPFGQFFFFRNYISRMGNRVFKRKKA